MHADYAVTLVCALITIALAFTYFSRVQVSRTPVVVVNGRNDMTKTYLRYAKYALTSLSTVGFAFSGS